MDPEDVIGDWAARAELQASLTTELSERLKQARASVESSDGEVSVTVDHSGGLADLRITERGMRLSADDLSEMILATSRRAQAQLAQGISELVNSLYGAGSDTASFIGGAYTAQFPQAEDQDEERDRR